MHATELIEYYSPPGAEVKAAAEKVRGRVPAIRELAERVETDHKEALDAVAGELEQSMADAPTDVVRNTTDVMRAAEFAAACLEYFSQSIDSYNYVKRDHPRSVSTLNAEYNQALHDSFGVHRSDPEPTASQEEQDKAEATFLADFQNARDAKVAELRKEAAELDTWLDGEADEVSAMLGRGPNESDVRMLYAAGALAPYASIVFPTLGLDAVQLPPAAQRELLQYLVDHAELLLDPPAPLAAVIAGLPVDLRTDISVEQRMAQLRQQGLLTGPNPGGYYERWIRNTLANGVRLDTVAEIARRHDIRPDDFQVLDGLREIKDRDGKSFFLLDTDTSGDAARRAALMTYVLNAGTGYPGGDYAPTPYGSDEMQRVVHRQDENSWSYRRDVGFVHRNGGRLVTTPVGTLMGAGGNDLQDLYSQKGGTTWGDCFMVNEDDLDHPDRRLEEIIRSGDAPNAAGLDLDRLLHHEERHSQQWARDGYLGFMWHYVWNSRKYERDAGLADGGYR